MGISQSQSYGHRAPIDNQFPSAESLAQRPIKDVINIGFTAALAIFFIFLYALHLRRPHNEVDEAIAKYERGNHDDCIVFNDTDEMFLYFGVDADEIEEAA